MRLCDVGVPQCVASFWVSCVVRARETGLLDFGVTLAEYSRTRSLPQGDTAATELFIFMLDCCLSPMVEEFRVQHIGWSFDEVHISHLLYADNIFLCARIVPRNCST